MIRPTLLAAVFLAGLAVPVLAAPCGAGGNGATTIHYDVGVTSLTAEDKAALVEFAETAKFKDAVCIFAQVDAQGSDEANKKVAEGRAQTVRSHLIKSGVPEDRILIAKEVKGQALFGLLDDSKNDRAVTVSWE